MKEKNNKYLEKIISGIYCDAITNDELLNYINNYLIDKNYIASFLDLLKDKDLISIINKNRAAFIEMLSLNKLDLLFKWYEKIGFVPHSVVMLNFPLEESDKFLQARKKWAHIMKCKNYTTSSDCVLSVLKVCKSFGVFDNDEKGYNIVLKMLYDLPKSINKKNYSKLKNITKKAKMYLNKRDYDGIDIDNLCDQFYSFSITDALYHLKSNLKGCKREYKLLRHIMEIYCFDCIVYPDLASLFFQNFNMDYNVEFRNFFVLNIETILEDWKYHSYISSMERKWKKIKELNCNRTLTIDVAYDFVKANEYRNIHTGNEKLADLSRIVGYCQDDFDKLQRIYDLGKKRVFSTIPRIKGSIEGYKYEILRLNDVYPLGIGPLSNCCFTINDHAELDMEHSMISEHGRVFAIYDNDNNLVAQSWVWRNKNVICFDNIEIPKKILALFTDEDQKSHFCNLIYHIYEKAAEGIINKEGKVYNSLIESGFITDEECNSFKLTKITVGMGYNDIARTVSLNAKLDLMPETPIPYKTQVGLKRELYTKDSDVQYTILEQAENTNIHDDSPAIYYDDYEVFINDNITHIEYELLQKMELETYISNYMHNTFVGDNKKIVSAIGVNYGLDPKNTRIIMNANFAIIYEINESIILGDILLSKSIDNSDNWLYKQISLALYQLDPNLGFNIEKLSQRALITYRDVLELNKDILIHNELKRALKKSDN